MRIGIVCPYSFDVPGGVQNHVRDLAETLIALGHDVSVLAPGDEEGMTLPYVVPAGRTVPETVVVPDPELHAVSPQLRAAARTAARTAVRAWRVMVPP